MGKFAWIGFAAAIGAVIFSLLLWKYPYLSDAPVPLEQPTSTNCSSIVIATAKSISGGTLFHGNLTVSNVYSLSGYYGFELWVSTEAQFQSWNPYAPGQGCTPPYDYEAVSGSGGNNNYNYYGELKQLNFPLMLISNSTSKYYFIIAVTPYGTSIQSVGLSLFEKTDISYGVTVIVDAILGTIAAVSALLNEKGWRQAKAS